MTSPIARAWHPVARSSDVMDAPHRTAVLGRALVAYRTPDGGATVVDGRCVHRGTDLALGTVRDGCLECPYHGWTFDAAGRCVRIPSMGEAQHVPPGAHLAPIASTEQDGLVWANLDPQADPSTVPRMPVSEPGLRTVTGDPMVWRTSAGRHLENILDLGHFPYVHPATFGCKEAEEVESHEVQVTPDGMTCDVGVLTQNPETSEDRLYPGLGPLIRLGYRYEVQVPYRITLRFAFPDGMRRELHEVICPTGPDLCTIYWLLLVDERLASDDEDELAFARQVFAEDQPVIESQPPGVPLHRQSEVQVPADRLAVAYRRALREFGCHEEELV